MANNSGSRNTGNLNVGSVVMPKEEILDYDFPFDVLFSTNEQDNVASSSGSNLRLDLVGMGFPPALVDKAIEENGEDNVELLVETLLAHSAPCKSEPLDSYDVFFNKDKEVYRPATCSKALLKEEHPDVFSGVSEKKASLLRMRFSVLEVDSAMDKLGEDAAICDIIDFILAAQMADKSRKSASAPVLIDLDKNQGLSTDALFGTMDKTLKLLDMGFTEQEVSTAIEKYCSEVPVSELAASIIAEQCGEEYIPTSLRRIRSTTRGYPHLESTVKVEYGLDDDKSAGNLSFMEKSRGKRPVRQGVNEPRVRKWLKQECDEDFSSLDPTWSETKHWNSVSLPNMQMPNVQFKQELLGSYGTTNLQMLNSQRTLSEVAAKPPYFLYGNHTSLSSDSWAKISQFLFAIRPEFVNTEEFSALSRVEGYIHNLPTENRFRLFPGSPMTIEEALPHTRKWRPSWDFRKKLSCISSEITGLSQLCEYLGKLLRDSRGRLSLKQQEDFLHQCQMCNLMWVGNHELAPIEPEQLEGILGYPANHTRFAGSSLLERFEALGNCFQIDTLAYHLSVLKSCFAGGLNLISIYSGIGGAEIALQRLGVQMKVVVSVDSSESNRRILKRWWENQGINGELVQIESIQRLSNSKLESLIKKYGGFDFVFCQSPCSNPSNSPLQARGGKVSSGFDFQLFYEFVRVLQCVRRTVERKRDF